MADQFSRTALLLGEEAVDRLKKSRVAVFGIGGVGAAAVEALARSGVGALVLVDDDEVALTNLNRQLIALHSTLGQPKVEAARARVLDINPDCAVEAHKTFYLPGEGQGLMDGCDYVIDAIDTVTAKIALIREALEKGIPIVSSMGTGNKLDPSQLRIDDLKNTSVCPLCRVMRRELKKRGIEHLKVLFSKEEPKARGVFDPEAGDLKNGRQPPASYAVVTPVAGMMLAGEVIKDLTGVRE